MKIFVVITVEQHCFSSLIIETCESLNIPIPYDVVIMGEVSLSLHRRSEWL